MNIINRFIDGIFILTNEKAFIKDIGYESLNMDVDEIDDNIVPQNITCELENPILTWSADFTDLNGDYYLYMAIDRIQIALSPYEVWFKNGVKIPNPFE